LYRSKDIIEKAMLQDARLFDKWTLQGLFDDLDTIELFNAPGYSYIFDEIIYSCDSQRERGLDR